MDAALTLALLVVPLAWLGYAVADLAGEIVTYRLRKRLAARK